MNRKDYLKNAEELWNDMEYLSQDLPALVSATKTILANMPRYLEVARSLHMPDKCAAVIGVLHMRESGFDFATHLANGDPLTADTVHVPKDLMRPLPPPYGWEEAAIVAMEHEAHGWNIDLAKYPWDIGNTLWFINAFNGFGYPPEVKTPYLWSYTQHYEKGKFGADGVYDPNLIDQQPGAAPVLKLLGYGDEEREKEWLK